MCRYRTDAALKTKDRQFYSFVVTDDTVSCLCDNLRCHQWQQSYQIDVLLFSVCPHWLSSVVSVQHMVCSGGINHLRAEFISGNKIFCNFYDLSILNLFRLLKYFLMGNKDPFIIHSQYQFYWRPGGCFTKVSRALQNVISKFVYCRNRTSYENFKLKLCTCAQSMAYFGHGFGHTCKVSAWNSHHKCYFWHCIFSRDYFGKLTKR